METLEAVKRTVVGKRVRTLRKKALIPGIVYGQGRPSVAVAVPRRSFETLWRRLGENSLFGLQIADDEPGSAAVSDTVIIHDVAQDPLYEDPLHIDFYRVSMSDPIEVRVPLEFTGTSPAVATLGGVLVKNLHDIGIRALPQNIPHEIAVDISALQTFDDQILVYDIAVPAGVTVLEDGENVVAAVQAPRSDEEIEGTGAPAPSIEDIEVEKRGKEAETEESEAEAES